MIFVCEPGYKKDYDEFCIINTKKQVIVTGANSSDHLRSIVAV